MNMARNSSPDLRRFILFLGAGVINTLFGYGAFAFFLWLGVGNDLSVVLGMISGIIFNYGTIGAVFASRGFSRLPHFLGVYGALLLANMLSLRILTTNGINPYVGEALIVACITPLSFFAMRRFVFASPPEPTP
jgi:putative flippase GtrA